MLSIKSLLLPFLYPLIPNCRELHIEKALCREQSPRESPVPLPVSSSDLEVYDIGRHQDAHTLQEVPNHVNEGSSDTGVLLLAAVVMAVPMAVAMSRLMKGQAHSVGADKAQGLHEVSSQPGTVYP